ncbi:MAG: hypothetical protein A2Z11_04540 [Candidatus Woykebacteria bacterium RBG_16_43_9]|uniref:Bacterial Ig-like domain-containing protein n=1 Tax=Candidatus Woykebacteria bacterium RBG_16_43_9 TaxID=1802596 RepID=A0A1G1WDY3_9BACT|nr:MAG: hypothetical protein A2Z11_04540 [Candidatus Woykebacteria bacterium RBG_16_43_9]
MISALKVYFLLLFGLVASGITLILIFSEMDKPRVLHSVTTTSPLQQYNFTTDQLHCFEYFLGNPRYNDLVNSGFSILTTEESHSIASCWNSTGTVPPEPSTEYSSMNPLIAECWRAKVGAYRFEHIVSVGFEPTTTEYEKLNQCYSELNPPASSSSSTNTTNQQTSASEANSTYSTVGERYPVGSPQRDCVKSLLGSDFTWFNNTANPNATGEYERFQRLEDKAAQCFESHPPPPSSDEPQYFMTPEMISCLKKAVGVSRFEAISSGKSTPTPSEAEKGQLCFEKFYNQERPKVEYSSASKLDKEVESCLEIAVGDKRLNKISLGQSTPTKEELKKGRECFGDSSSPFAPPAVLKVDTKIKECINSAVNNDRLAKIKSGDMEPSDSERNKVASCFEKINALQLAFLPIPPEQIPFLKVNSSLGSIENVETTYQTSDSGKEQPVVTYTGAGKPNSSLDLYFFSDPIVVTVDTDANGTWSYNLDVPLDSGEHVSYIAAKNDGEAVRSEMFRFSVAQAEAADGREGGLIVKNTGFADQVNNYLVWVGGLILVGIAGLVSIVIYRNRKKTQQNFNAELEKQL